MIASHLVLNAYGFWLPNDPRGSGSRFVGSRNLFRYGKATALSDRSVPVSRHVHNHAQRQAAKNALKFAPVRWTGEDALVIVRAFEIAVRASGYRFWALAVLPDHVHLVVAAHDHEPHQIAGHLKGRATRLLRLERDWPQTRPVWGERSWASYLDTSEAVLSAIEYVRNNPSKSGLKPQRWSIVQAPNFA